MVQRQSGKSPGEGDFREHTTPVGRKEKEAHSGLQTQPLSFESVATWFVYRWRQVRLEQVCAREKSRSGIQS